MYNSLPLQRAQFVFSISLSPKGNKANLLEKLRIIFSCGIPRNFPKLACMFWTLSVRKHSQWELDIKPAVREEAIHISKIAFLFVMEEALNKNINMICKCLFPFIFHNNIRIGSRSCQNWRCVWSEGDSEFIRVISDKVRVVKIELGWLAQ